jgi:hypothetical protein
MDVNINDWLHGCPYLAEADLQNRSLRFFLRLRGRELYRSVCSASMLAHDSLFFLDGDLLLAILTAVV